jgi:hypothetical protein
MKKWTNELNRNFSKKEVQMSTKYMKKCSPLLAIKKMQIKTKVRFHLTSVRTPPPKNCGKDVGKRNPHKLLVGM